MRGWIADAGIDGDMDSNSPDENNLRKNEILVYTEVETHGD